MLIEKGANIKLGYTGTVVATAPDKGGGQCMADACKQRTGGKMVELAKAEAFSVSALKGNLALSMAFAAAEIGWNLYWQWGNADISWQQFRLQSYEVVIGQATSAVTSWAGAGLAVLLVASVTSCGAAVFLAAAFGGMVGGAVGQYYGRKGARRVLGPQDFNDDNARTIVAAMDALNMWVENLEELSMDQVRENYINLSKQIHPDKVHQRDGESEKGFQERKATANLRMSLLNHHYKVLKSYIESRGQSTLWTSVPVEEFWEKKMQDKQLRLKG